MDNRGPWLVVGASAFAAANRFKFDPTGLERTLRWLFTEKKVDYIRALACVGAQPYWQGREVDPGWDDYEAVIHGTTRFVRECGGRIMWTFFGDAQLMAPSLQDRQRVVDIVAAACNDNPEAVIAAEGANEWWQNGFGGSAGVAQLRDLVRRFADRCGVPVATSCPAGANEEEQQESARDLYEGSAATFTTNHYDRAMGEEGWRPARQPWQQLSYGGVPDGSLNNEPIGVGTPGGNNPTDSNPHRQVAQAIVSWISGHWGYCVHDRTAGVRMDKDWSAVENIDRILDGLTASRALLPADLPNWAPQNDHWVGHPFQRMSKWVDGASEGVTRAYAAVDGARFVCLPMGIKVGVNMTAKASMAVTVRSVLTGDVVTEQNLSGGQTMRLTDSQPVYLVIGQ